MELKIKYKIEIERERFFNTENKETEQIKKMYNDIVFERIRSNIPHVRGIIRKQDATEQHKLTKKIENYKLSKIIYDLIDNQMHKINRCQLKYYLKYKNNRFLNPSHQISDMFYETIYYVELVKYIITEDGSDNKNLLMMELERLFERIAEIIVNDKLKLLSIEEFNNIFMS
jgi:hypothetical protein